MESNFWFKIHLGLSISFSLLAFGAWCITRIFFVNYPWFIFPIGASLMALSLHYYGFVLKRETLVLHFSWLCIINAVIFLTWVFQANYSGSLWFIYPFSLTAIPFSALFCLITFGDSIHVMMNFHMIVFVILNLCFFMAYIDLGKGYPWFLIPLFLTSGFLAIHWSYHYYPTSLLKLHMNVFVNIQCFLFFLWAINGGGFPWFALPLLGWGSILSLHALISSRKQRIPIIVQDSVKVGIHTPPCENINELKEVQIGNLDEFTIGDANNMEDLPKVNTTPTPTAIPVSEPTAVSSMVVPHIVKNNQTLSPTFVHIPRSFSSN